MVRVLNVAEKPSVAKEVSHILGGSSISKRPGKSQYNPIFEFPYTVKGTDCTMVFTSVSGHLLEKDFVEPYRKKWTSCPPGDLFHLPVTDYVPKNNEKIFQTLQIEARKCQWLILWLDCDREGENIAFEVLNVCRKQNSSMVVYRARFSKIVVSDIRRAIGNLTQPNQRDSDAVSARQEADLRIGAAFTRWQTKHLQSKFSGLADQPISYGPCQFPTLGFVVERYRRIETFVEEPFWAIEVHYKSQEEKKRGGVLDEEATFSWKRGRLFDRLTTVCLYELCMESPMAEVTKLEQEEQKRWKPFPLNTVAFQKLSSRKLRMSSEKAMSIAEKLYTQGYISYPRTETEIFEPGTDLHGLIRIQTEDPSWGDYATFLLDQEGFEHPRAGKGNDHSHPPIHPTKRATNLQADERKVYELVTRSFLAACSKDALVHQTKVEIEIAKEIFSVSGLAVLELNFLHVYTYQKKLVDKAIPTFQLGERFVPNEIKMIDGRTRPPNLLSEADLISLMDKNGIGTDATIAQHIQTLLSRRYAEKKGAQKLFSPTTLGLALVDGYDAMGLNLSKPDLRANLEKELVDISAGRKQKGEVLESNLANYVTTFNLIRERTEFLDTAMERYFNPVGLDFRIVSQNFSLCGNCNIPTKLKSKGEENILSCEQCGVNLCLPKGPPPTPHEHICPLCNFQVLVVQSRAANSYHVCPSCSNQSEDMSMPCFKCTARCPLARGSRPPFRSCPACPAGKFQIKKRKSSVPGAGDYFVACTEYPNCKASFSLPSETESAVTLTDQPCPRCSTPASQCFRVQLQFKRPIPGFGRELVGCLGGCDPNINQLISRDSETSNSYLIPAQGTSQQSQMPKNKQRSFERSYDSLSRGFSKNTTRSPSVAPSSSVQTPAASWKPPAASWKPPAASWKPPAASPPPTSNFSAPSRVSPTSYSPPSYSPSSYSSSSYSPPSYSSSSSRVDLTDDGDEDLPRCQCGNKTVRLTVKKRGPHQGREFWKCVHFKEANGCQFFEWVDGEGALPATRPSRGRKSSKSPKSSSSVTRTSTKGRGRSTARGRSSTSRGSGGGNQGCFKCGEPGHWANDCPN